VLYRFENLRLGADGTLEPATYNDAERALSETEVFLEMLLLRKYNCHFFQNNFKEDHNGKSSCLDAKRRTRGPYGADYWKCLRKLLA
jgi:hypothetical protein